MKAGPPVSPVINGAYGGMAENTMGKIGGFLGPPIKSGPLLITGTGPQCASLVVKQNRYLD